MVCQAMIKMKRRDKGVLQQLLMKTYEFHYNNQFDNNQSFLSKVPLHLFIIGPYYLTTRIPNQSRKHNKDRDKLGKKII